jgi:hypothetical protein
MDPLLLTPQELADICTLSFGTSCDAPEDAAPLALAQAPDGTWRAWLAEYPEEGSVQVHERKAEPGR